MRVTSSAEWQAARAGGTPSWQLALEQPAHAEASQPVRGGRENTDGRYEWPSHCMVTVHTYGGFPIVLAQTATSHLSGSHSDGHLNYLWCCQNLGRKLKCLWGLERDITKFVHKNAWIFRPNSNKLGYLVSNSQPIEPPFGRMQKALRKDHEKWKEMTGWQSRWRPRQNRNTPWK